MANNAAAFAGVSFHCYEGMSFSEIFIRFFMWAAGNYGQQGDFRSAYPNKEIYLTECTGETGS